MVRCSGSPAPAAPGKLASRSAQVRIAGSASSAGDRRLAGAVLEQRALPRRILRPAQLVQRVEGQGLAGGADPDLLQQHREQPPVGNPDPHVRGRESERPHHVDAERDDLRVAQRARLADQIAIELEVFPEPAALLPLVAEELRNRKPPDRFAEPVGALRHHAGQRRRHLGAERDLAPALVGESVELARDLLAALAGVELERLQRRPVVLLEGVAAGHPRASHRRCGPGGRIPPGKNPGNREGPGGASGKDNRPKPSATHDLARDHGPFRSR